MSEKNKGGRPSGFKEEYIESVGEYLAENQDVFKNKRLYVRLPTMGGFALFIGVPERCLYDWRKKFPKFSRSLEKILKEQEKRLINSGLSGEYNSTIAKLILSSNHGMRERSDHTSDDKPIGTEFKVTFDDFSDEPKNKPSLQTPVS